MIPVIAQTVATEGGGLVNNLLGGLAVPLMSVLGALLAWLLTWLKSKNEAATRQSRYNLAMQRVLDMAASFGQRVWTKLEPQIQLAMADGQLSYEERLKIEEVVKAELVGVVNKDEIEKLGKDLGLPFSGVIASIVSRLIELAVQSRDPGSALPRNLFRPNTPEVEFPVGG